MPTAPGSLVDVHVHLAVLGRDPAEGYVSPRMLRGALGRLIARWLGGSPRDPARLTALYRERLERDLAGSRYLRAAVVLGLDGVYGADGRLDLARTHLYVPNDAPLALARANPRVLAGASVHPLRRDALDELERVAALGAVLVKWLPNAQHFDPADPAVRPFYRALARLKLPLLIHTGVEYSVRSHAQDAGDPRRWRDALEAGVDVIAAHGGSTGLFVWERYARGFFELLERYSNLSADSSALGIPSRALMLRRIAARGFLDRLTFGTDWPLPCFPSLLLARGAPRAMLEVRRESNPFDRYVRFFEAMGWAPRSLPLERAPAPAGASA